MKENGGRRTRSQAEPEWSVTESLILVNEIAAAEAECPRELSSYQRWDVIAENCAALGVSRSLPQCRRKWRALLVDYDDDDDVRRRKASPKSRGTSLEPELFEAIERVVKAREQRGQLDHESDPEPANEALDATVQIGSRRKRQRSKPEMYCVQQPKKCRPVEPLEKQDQRGCLEQRPEESQEEEPENHHLEEEYLKDFLEERHKLKCAAKRRPKHIETPPKSLAKVELDENHEDEKPKLTSVGNITNSREENEEMLTLKLQELAIEIQAITAESADIKTASSQSIEDYHTEFTRRQGDKLIASLGNFSNTLKQLCGLLQECK